MRVVDRSDLTPALALAAVAALEAIVYSGWVEDSDGSIAVALNLLMTAPLALRRTHLTLVAVTVTVSVLYLLASQLTPTVAGYAGVAWMLYLVGARSSRRLSIGLGAVFLLNGVAPLGGSDAGLESAILLVVAVGALALGSTRTLTSERDEALAEQAALDERARIARELHDVVAHHMSMIAVQAETAPPGPPACRPPARGARLDRGVGPRGADRDAAAARRAAQDGGAGRARAAAGPRPAAGCSTARAPARRAADRRAGAPRRCPTAVVARGVPHRAGGARQRHAGTRRARPSRSGPAGTGDLQRRGPQWTRPTRPAAAAGRGRARARRDARAGRAAGRELGRRPRPGGGFAVDGPAAARGERPP